MVTRSKVAAAYLDRARLSGLHTDYKKAEKHFRALSSLSPANADSRLGFALALMGQHRFAEALLQAREGAEMLEHPAGVAAILGDIHFALGNYVEAEWAYRKLNSDGRTLPSLARMAQIHAVRGRDEKAAKAIKDACEAGGVSVVPALDASWCKLMQGEIAIDQGRAVDAVSAFERALELAPVRHTARLRTAEAAMILGDPDRAVETLEKLIREHPLPRYQAALGKALRDSGRIEDARAWFDKARDAYEDEFARGDIGHIREYTELLLVTGENPARALELARREFAGIRQDLGAHVTLAKALAANEQYEAAADRIHRALQVGSRAPWLVRSAGVLFARAGRLAEAQLYLTRALQTPDAYATAEGAEARAVMQAVDTEVARRAAAKAARAAPQQPSPRSAAEVTPH